MNNMNFNHYVIRERNQRMLGEINSLRLKERLRDNGGSNGSRFIALADRGLMPLLGRVRLAR